jgi:transcription antitermination factor NusA-like protein
VKKRAAVFVEEAQRPMAIGKKGQNIRLATQLTGYELDMYNYEELPAFKAKLAELKGEEIAVTILTGEGVAEEGKGEKKEKAREASKEDAAPAKEEAAEEEKKA